MTCVVYLVLSLQPTAHCIGPQLISMKYNQHRWVSEPSCICLRLPPDGPDTLSSAPFTLRRRFSVDGFILRLVSRAVFPLQGGLDPLARPSVLDPILWMTTADVIKHFILPGKSTMMTLAPGIGAEVFKRLRAMDLLAVSQ